MSSLGFGGLIFFFSSFTLVQNNKEVTVMLTDSSTDHKGIPFLSIQVTSWNTHFFQSIATFALFILISVLIKVIYYPFIMYSRDLIQNAFQAKGLSFPISFWFFLGGSVDVLYWKAK